MFKGDDNNTLAYHVRVTGHNIQWTDTEVLETNVQHLTKRKINDIRRTNNLNMDCGVSLFGTLIYM